ncbi:histidinol phosphate phosphatase, partial [candidate division WOR-3 bacterium]|nr:histidinol phosphate phosphatase [candidate division WOR-3 bacterium]
VENGNFDILGHMDYYKKYSKFNHNNTLKRYYTIIKEILQVIIDRGKTLEINTSGLRHKCNEQFPSNDFLQLYKDMGGTLISIGSDSHRKEHIGFGISNANKLITEYKFKHFLHLEETCQE